MKRLFALFLAMILVLGMAVTVSATGTDTVKLTVNGEHSGHTYVAYQIFAGDVTNLGVISNVQWGSGINNPDALLAALKADTTTIVNGQDTSISTNFSTEFLDVTSAGAAATVMATWGDNRERINYFADFLYKKSYLSTVYATATATAANPTVYEFNLAPGYYLIKDMDNTVNDQNHDFYTKFIVALTSDVNVAVKGTVPRVEKKVSATLQDNYGTEITSQLNLNHYYELIGYLPSNINDYASYYYKFVDTLSDGLDFVQIEEAYLERVDGVKVYFYQRNNDSLNPALAPTTAANNSSVTVEWANLKAVGFPAIVSSDKIVVKYSATLNERAIVGAEGNENEVKLVYSNNPHGSGTGTTVTDETTVYTFGLRVVKIDGATKNEAKPTKLAGAKFKLYHEHAHDDHTQKLFAVVVDGMITDWVTDETQGTELTTDANGQITFKGLKEGVLYYLRETESPAGFNLLMRDIPVEITSYNVDVNGKVTSVVYEADNIQNTLTCTDENTGIITAVVENKGGNTLPSTGGMGTTILYLAGGILVLAAVVMLVTKKRMANVD